MEGGISVEQQYALKWNDFHLKIMSSFQNLRNDFDFVDVTLACENCSFSAHKVILSACSPYFRKLLKANPCQHPIIILRDVKKKNLENLLLFMYNGEVHIEPTQFPDFLKTAKMLQIQGLADIKHNFTPPNQRFTSETQTSRRLSESDSSRCETFSPSEKRIDRESSYHSRSVSFDQERDNNSGVSKSPENSSPKRQHSEDPKTEEKQIDDHQSKHKEIEEIIINDEPVNPKLEPYEDPMTSEQSLIASASNLEDIASNDPTFSGALMMIQNQPETSQMRNNMADNFDMKHMNFEHNDYRSGPSQRFSQLNPENNRCPVCRRNYSSPSNLRAHVLNVHTPAAANNWYQCRECGKKLKTKHYLINHEMRAHGIRQRSKRPSVFNFLNEDTM